MCGRFTLTSNRDDLQQRFRFGAGDLNVFNLTLATEYQLNRASDGASSLNLEI